MNTPGRHVLLPNAIDLFVREVDFTDPWKPAPAVLMLHGTAESGEAFRAWHPTLARHFRLVCPDLRGAGSSTRIPALATLEMDDLVEDMFALMRELRIQNYFIVGEKVGALLALRMAAHRPGEVAGLAVACGMIAPRDVVGPWVPDWIRMVKEQGTRAWVDATQAGRMGSDLEPEALEWWSTLMASSDPRSLIAYLDMLQRFALSHDELRAVRAPTLFLMPSGAPAAGATFEQRRPAAELAAWQGLVENHEVASIACSSYHLAATHPDACAAVTRDFLLRIASNAGEDRRNP